MIHFKERLKQLRLEHGLSQKELADLLGVSKSTISGYEAGTYQPSFDNMIRLANIFNVAVDYFYSTLRKPVATYKNGVRVPVIASVSANIDIAEELDNISDKTPLNILGFKNISPKYKAKHRQYFIFEQNNVHYTIHIQPDTSDSDTVLACIDGKDAEIYYCKNSNLIDAHNNTCSGHIKIIGICVNATLKTASAK